MSSILKSDQPNVLKQAVPAEDPWGNQANNPHRMKSRMKKMQARHLEQNNIVTKLEVTIEEHAAAIQVLEVIVTEKDLEIETLKQDLTIAEGKVAAKAKAAKKKPTT